MKRNILSLTFLIVLATAIAIAQAPTNSQPQQNVPGQTSQSETQNNSAGSISGNASPTNTAPGQTQGVPAKPAQSAPGTPDPTTPTVDQNAAPQQQAPNAYTAPTSNATTDSATLKSQLESAYQAEPTLTGANIQVAVTDSTIDLTGTVPGNKEKITAKRIAQSYAANRKVSDHMTVAGKGAPAPNANPAPKK